MKIYDLCEEGMLESGGKIRLLVSMLMPTEGQHPVQEQRGGV